MSHRSKRHAGSEPSSSEVSQGASHDHGFPAEHRRGLLPEEYFRWRGGEITRLEAFCDVVFGFALTLLVVSLEVPRNYGEMMAAMRGFLPFAVCFAQLIMIWRSHYQFSRRYGLEDPYTVFLNIVLLFLVLFYVYPLKFVFNMLFSQVFDGEAAVAISFHQAQVMMEIYAVGFTAVFLLFALMYGHAYKLRSQLGLDEVEVLETRVSLQQNSIMAVTGAVSFALALRNPGWAGWWYFVLGPALGVHAAINGKRVRLLAEKTRPA